MKQNIIQSIIRRGLSFVLLSLLMPLGVGAQTNYNLWIGNTQVTSENAGDVLGDGKVAFSVGGDVAVVYTLTLKGAELTAPVKVGLSNLTFDIQGTNSITTSEACIQKMDNTSPSLTFKSNADVVGSLILTSNNGPISEIGEGNITISKELAVLLKVYGTEDYTSRLYFITDGSTTMAKFVPSYGVSIDKDGSGKVDIYAGNAADVFGDRTVSFDKTTNTLTLNGANRGAISTSLAELTIELIGPNTLSEQGSYPVLRSLYGDDVTITIQSTDGSGGLTMNMPRTEAGNFCDENVTLTISDPLDILSGSLTGNDGNENTVEIGLDYGIWVAGTQVTTANANDIKGDGIVEGEATFDGDNTLKLSGADLNGPIQTSLANLIVEINGECSLSVDQYAFIAKESTCKITFATKNPLSRILVPSVQSAPFSGFADGNIIFANDLEGKIGQSDYVIAVPNDSYGFSVELATGAVEVTKQNRLTIGDGVKFDGQNTLILTNANINKISISADHNLKSGLKIYLIGDNNKIGSQASDGLVNQSDKNIPLTFATSDLEPGTLALSYAQPAQPLVGFVPTYLNNLTDMMNPDQQQITIAVSMEPFVTQNGEEKTEDGGGVGLGKDIEYAETSILQAGILVNKILYTLPDVYDGYWLEDSKKLVAINSSMTDADANTIMAAVIDGSLLPGTPDFAKVFHGMTFLLPAGSGDIVLDVNTNHSGELHVKVGNNDPVFISGTTGFEERRVPYALTEESYVFLYSVAPVVSSSRFRAPGRKMANTTTLKSVKVSARSVAATPPPVLMPKVLTKDDVAAAKSGNHITITDTDVTDYADNAFDGQTGITYVDLSATSITGKIIDRTKLPKWPADAIVFLPASNDDNLAKNIVIAGVCNDLQLNDAVDFEIPSDFTAVKASLSRDFTSDLGKNCTVCVPFALDDTQAAELGTFYTLSAHSENTITMESVDATEANKAYMFKPAKETFSAEMVDVKKADPVRTTVSSLSFLGTYQKITGLNSTADFVYYCFMKDGPQAGKFVKITSDVIVNPFRAYMELPASKSLARVLDLNFGEGGATGIGSLTPNPSPIGEGNVGFYDLQGRRVLYPKKGLYILNGKKVIIK